MTPVHMVNCIKGEKSRAEGQAVFEQATKKPVSYPKGRSSHMVAVMLLWLT